ncbi:nuclear pore complex protein Nup50-like [Actinia tenebrosa]|uniref:Nuclear pore complex protein Nup50-like n=1 Tax=Actinia tenebrosa TaxID=6105 RepID=A0A6P8INX9_ACTTE|nr:nuclear pore complex protein Nup50-like [Actinia tenebrosa]
MAKRGAGSELNRDNWDDDDEIEEAGTFTIASEEDLNKRKIIRARRRIPSDANSKSSGVFQKFKGFSGFSGLSGSSSTTDASKSLPGFGSWGSTTSKTETTTATTIAGFTGFAGLSATNSISSSSKDSSIASSWSTFNGNKDSEKTETLDDTPNNAYLENIKALNIGVLAWIKKHVEENPYVDLMPVFKDYRKHMDDLESKATPNKDSPGIKPLPSITPPSSSGSKVVSSNEQQVSSKSLDFKSSVVPEVRNEEKPFAGLAAAAMASKDNGNDKAENEDEPSDEPPKLKSVITAEEGSQFSVRCKLFFKRNNAWSELGVGMLNLKDKDDKSQLLVRADTATGKILLNIFIAPSMPVTRSGKNNVMLVSIPNPPLYSKPSEGDNEKPATYLIRVKTAESADDLFKKLEERK